MSNYAQQLEQKLVGAKKVSILDVNVYLDNLLELAGNAVTEFNQVDKSDELEAKDSTIEDLEEKITELEDEATPPNLLDYQLKACFDEIISSPFINQLKFLQLLEKIEKIEIKL